MRLASERTAMPVLNSIECPLSKMLPSTRSWALTQVPRLTVLLGDVEDGVVAAPVSQVLEAVSPRDDQALDLAVRAVCTPDARRGPS